MSLHGTTHQSLSDCWILLSLVISSLNLATSQKVSQAGHTCIHCTPFFHQALWWLQVLNLYISVSILLKPALRKWYAHRKYCCSWILFTILCIAYDENYLNIPFGATFLLWVRSLSRRGCLHDLGSSPAVSVTELNEGDVECHQKQSTNSYIV